MKKNLVSLVLRAHKEQRSVRARLLTSDVEGQALLEFALLLPLLLMVVTGIYAFGLAFNQYLQLTEATSVGAELLGFSRGQTADPCYTAAYAIQNSAPLLDPTKISYTFVLNGNSYGPYSGLVVAASGSAPASSLCPTSSNAGATLAPGVPATVTVTYPCNLTVYLFSQSTFNMGVAVTEIIQ